MASVQDQIAGCFIKLLKIKPYDKVTIQMICDNTPTSRNTFYYHFENKDKLVEWICIRDFMKYCFPYFKLKTENIATKSFFSYILEKKDFYKAIYDTDEGQLLRRCLVASYAKVVTKAHISEYANIVSNNQHKIDIRIFCAYSNHGIASIVLFWIGQGMKIPVESMARDMTIMLTKSLEEVRDQYLFD